MLINDVFSFDKNKLPKIILISVAILRGMCDTIENIILLCTLYTYPRINELAISIAANFTLVKFVSIKV